MVKGSIKYILTRLENEWVNTQPYVCMVLKRNDGGSGDRISGQRTATGQEAVGW